MSASQQRMRCTYCLEISKSSDVSQVQAATHKCNTCDGLYLCTTHMLHHQKSTNSTNSIQQPPPHQHHDIETLKIMSILEAQQKFYQLKQAFTMYQSKVGLTDSFLKTIDETTRIALSKIETNYDQLEKKCSHIVDECEKKLSFSLQVEVQQQTIYVSKILSISKSIKLLFLEIHNMDRIQVNYQKAISLFRELKELMQERSLDSLGKFNFETSDGYDAAIVNILSPYFKMKYNQDEINNNNSNVDEMLNNINIQYDHYNNSINNENINNTNYSNNEYKFSNPIVPSSSEIIGEIIVEHNPPMVPFSFNEKVNITITKFKDISVKKGLGFAYSYKEKLAITSDGKYFYFFNSDNGNFLYKVDLYTAIAFDIIRNFDGNGNEGLIIYSKESSFVIYNLHQILEYTKLSLSIDNLKPIEKFTHLNNIEKIRVKNATIENLNNNGKGTLIYCIQNIGKNRKLLILNLKCQTLKEYIHGCIDNFDFLDDYMITTDFTNNMISIFQEQYNTNTNSNNNNNINWVYINTIYGGSKQFIYSMICIDPMSKSIFITHKPDKKKREIHVFKIEMGNLIFIKKLKDSMEHFDLFHIYFNSYNGKLWIWELYALARDFTGKITLIE